LALLIFECFEDVLPQGHDVANIDITSKEGIADLFEALLHCLIINDCRFVEALEGFGYFFT
jgi:hypothetical protein